MKIALVHDYLIQYGGAERVLENLIRIYPDAEIFTTVYTEKTISQIKGIKKEKLHHTFIQKLPQAKKNYQKYFLFFPFAIENMDMSKFDIVISISSAWTKGVVTLPRTMHVSYILNPMRFAWNEYFFTLKKLKKKISRWMVSSALNWVRMWDTISTERIDHIITISNTIMKRVLKYYKRESVVIYPPVNISFFDINPHLKIQDFFLCVSRLKYYKRIDIAINAFNKLGLPLLVIGKGEAEGFLKRIARPNIQFLSSLSDEEIRSYYQRAQALIVPQEEDFGIAPIEALACGTPVIGFKGGGVEEVVRNEETGILFAPQKVESLVEAVKKFDREKFDRKKLRESVLKFGEERFKEEFSSFIQTKFQEWQSQQV
jgi:glycosyltransferase involved in cell wall biosynthesis